MRISIPGLGGRLRLARNEIGLSQEAVAERIGVSWITIHRWERSQRSVPDNLLQQLCELYDKPIRWFLTLEDGDLGQENEPSGERLNDARQDAAERVHRKISEAPAEYLTLVEKVVEDLLDGLREASGAGMTLSG